MLPPIKLGKLMLSIYSEKREEGWQEWLKKHHLLDPGKSDQELYLRYKKFKGLEMGPVVSPADHGLFYCDLLPLEASLVCVDAIGHMAQHPFNFKVLDE